MTKALGYKVWNWKRMLNEMSVIYFQVNFFLIKKKLENVKISDEGHFWYLSLVEIQHCRKMFREVAHGVRNQPVPPRSPERFECGLCPVLSGQAIILLYVLVFNSILKVNNSSSEMV